MRHFFSSLNHFLSHPAPEKTRQQGEQIEQEGKTKGTDERITVIEEM